jgi:hypothetical protein
MRLVYTRTRTLGAALIRAMPPWGPWSHCATVWGDDVIEAVAVPPGRNTLLALLRDEGRVIRRPLADLLAGSSAWMLCDLTVPREADAYDYAVSRIGHRYDHGGVLAVPTRVRPWADAERDFCSEALLDTTAAGGLELRYPGMHGATPTQCAHLTHAAGHRVVGAGVN